MLGRTGFFFQTRFRGSRLAGDGVLRSAAKLQGLIAGKPAPTASGFHPTDGVNRP
ncbi:hypothetical protein PHLH7_56390 [Pseudomonas sp. Ost2]|nr:hypothetical protein PHLH7_56390 [Pseudomonas sp. Ost2]